MARKLEITDADVMRIAIQQEIQRSDESRYDHRLHGLLLVTGGQSCRQVAQWFDEDPRTVRRWVRTFEERGSMGCATAKEPVVRARSGRINGRRRSGTCVADRMNSVWPGTCGTAGCSLNTCGVITA
ncbi:MAG: hypothetical protein M2R46_03697 [Verrucomicrobia subdivision 3 bacterium]|nr:hypothetical protein [Limisphaerales bacterium]